MVIIRELLALLRRGTPRLNLLELKILRAVESQLPLSSSEKLRRRIEQINLVQRLDGGREVNCYQMQAGTPIFDKSTRLLESNGEQVLARFAFDSSRNESFSGQVWLVDGFLFSLEFDNATEHIINNDIRKLMITLAPSVHDEASV